MEDYSPQGIKESDTIEVTEHAHTHSTKHGLYSVLTDYCYIY